MTRPRRAPPSPPSSDPVYIAHTVPGLERIARREMRDTFEGVEVLQVLERFDDRTSILAFRTDSDPGDFAELRTVEDVFVRAAHGDDVPQGRVGLALIKTLVTRDSALDAAAAMALAVRPRRKGKPTFRVVSRKAGEHAFRRVDVQHTVEAAVAERFPGWRLVDDDAQLELWASLVNRTFVLGIRLSDNEMRQRTYRQVSIPAALKPTVAAAMVLLSDPYEHDVVLDPLCGSGTLLIERALSGRYARLLGGDLDAEAVQATRVNVGPKYKPIDVEQWDTRSLPLADASVNRILSNLPFGKQIGTSEENRALYPALMVELNRVLEPAGRMVLLTSERTLLRRTLERRRGLVVEQQIPVVVRGFGATIFVVRKDSE